MYPLYKSSFPLDKRCYEKFNLTEDILMENASLGMANYIRSNFKKGLSLLIVAGVGNNGADGIVLARLLFGYCNVKLYIPFEIKSYMANLQLDRVKKLGIDIVNEVSESDIVVDAIFGAGLSRELDSDTIYIVEALNILDGFKLACDIPTGINKDGNPMPIAFRADTTITMGALKESLYSDNAKDYIGEVVCVELGVAREVYEIPSSSYLLEVSDMKLPCRDSKSTHKGSFGHLAVVSGEKEGASILTAMASMRFGVGLTTLVGEIDSTIPYTLMQNIHLPANTTAIAFGMGFGNNFNTLIVDDIINSDMPIVLDADIFHHNIVSRFIQQRDRDIVITPHPKEFVALWNRTIGDKDLSLDITLADIDRSNYEMLDIATLQSNRFLYVREFCTIYPHITLLLKGANMIIAKDEELFVNPYGSAKLSKGGSGDVLSGLIGSLLAQGYSTIDAATTASLALTSAAKAYNGSSYAMLPIDLIEEIAHLEKNSNTI